jgi:hypothetical protein
MEYARSFPSSDSRSEVFLRYDSFSRVPVART